MTSLFFFEIIKLADYEVGGLNYITPKLRTGIQKSFCNDAFFGIMRSDEMQQPMRVEFPLPDEDLMAIADGVENDENIEELAFDYEW